MRFGPETSSTMAKTDKPTDTSSGEWAKHLRPKGKRQFNKKIRKKSKTRLHQNERP